MVSVSVEEINDLVSKFSDKSLPKSEWNHQAHIIVGLWHNINYDFDIALDLVKSKIKAYNLSLGILNTDDSGYHETLTIFWMTLSKAFLLKYSSVQMEEVYHLFLQSKYASKNYPFEYYSRETLFSKEARKGWGNGDIKSVSFLFEN